MTSCVGFLTSISSVKRSSGTRREPCRAMATKLIPIAVKSTAATLEIHERAQKATDNMKLT